ncbi:MAG: hypothetical protein WC260_01615 [Candidatus Pacearchaeota archaeon]
MKYIILTSGKINSGKNVFSSMLGKEFNRKTLDVKFDLFANDLKNGARDDFKQLSSYLNSFVNRLKSEVGVLFDIKYNSPDKLKHINNIIEELNIIDDNWFENKTEITRLILQLYGTEIFRNRVDNNYWANQVKKRALESDSDVYIVTDTRFPNEISCFNDINDDNIRVIPIRIERVINTQLNIAQHDSETALDNWNEWCYIIDNNGSIDDLRDSAEVIVQDIINTNYESNTFGDNIYDNIKKLEKLN